MTLTEFLLARIAEDEPSRFGGIGIDGKPFPWLTRKRAECEAKRRIVADAAEYFDHAGGIESTDGLAVRVLELLALPYADHPDYDQRWRP